MFMGSTSWAQNITNTLNNVNFTIPLTFSTLTPGTGGTLLTQQATVRLRCSCAAGYHLRASLTSFVFTPIGASAGAADISRSDIGMGIVQANIDTSPVNVIKPRTDTVVAGFNYNPGAAAVANGKTPFGGVALGQARLSDITAGNVNILSGPRIAANQNTGGANAARNYIGVTIIFAALPQYWTPGTVNAMITLQIVSP
jgi:hypothetical protein